MRIVAGTAGGIPLKAPPTGVRPTMDRVKGAIFSSLGDRIPGARVLDLFAGTGALGIEALSRGCASAVFVENDSRVIPFIEDNLKRAGLEGDIHPMDIFLFLDRMARPGGFDLIFADPPYARAPGERDFSVELIASRALHAALAPDGLFILEKLPRAALALDDRWETVRARTYGATEVLFLRPSASGG